MQTDSPTVTALQKVVRAQRQIVKNLARKYEYGTEKNP